MSRKSDLTLKNHILKKSYFIPMNNMHTVIDALQNRKQNPFIKKKRRCDNNLYLLQRTRLNTFDYSVFGKVNWMTMFTMACHKAAYANDWDKLLYLLIKVPKWKIKDILIFDSIYTRYLNILLMYHPSSQAQGLLCEYLHMTWGCRSEQDKKAILKVLLYLPKKLPKPIFHVNVNMRCDEKEKTAEHSD